MQRFYLPPSDFSGDYASCHDKKLVSQIAKVLRAKEGDRFFIFNNLGGEYLAQLIKLDGSCAEFLLIDKRDDDRELKTKIIIYQSLLKSDKLDLILQKLAEIGVYAVVPVISDRCVVKDISPAKRKRYGEIIKEAIEQCGGTRLMEFGNLVNFHEAINWCSQQEGDKLISWEKEIDNNFKSEINNKIVHIFVGPEGGYEDEEIEGAKALGLKTVGLGKRILRAETAAIFVASVLAMSGK